MVIISILEDYNFWKVWTVTCLALSTRKLTDLLHCVSTPISMCTMLLLDETLLKRSLERWGGVPRFIFFLASSGTRSGPLQTRMPHPWNSYWLLMKLKSFLDPTLSLTNSAVSNTYPSAAHIRRRIEIHDAYTRDLRQKAPIEQTYSYHYKTPYWMPLQPV